MSKHEIASPVVRVRRNDPTRTTVTLLFVRAAGRCQFDGCNQYLLEHPLTKRVGNFGQVAHVVAFRKDGPRGAANRPADINDLSNLMLLCPSCHKQVDDHPKEFTRQVLESYKRRHEDRIFHLTGLGPDLTTTIVQFKARIGDKPVEISAANMIDAVSPRYPTERKPYLIDLSGISERDPGYYSLASAEVEREVRRLYAPSLDGERMEHISLFALAPIPLLVYLGSRLSDKVPVDLFQRHRDSEDWTWKTEPRTARYTFECVRHGAAPGNVALLLSLSGTIELDQLPDSIGADFWIYELRLQGTPNPLFMRARTDLDAFRQSYQQALREIEKHHDGLAELHLFPAVPAPAAVACGRERSSKTDPSFVIYDQDRTQGGFVRTLRID